MIIDQVARNIKLLTLAALHFCTERPATSRRKEFGSGGIDIKGIILEAKTLLRTWIVEQIYMLSWS